MRSLMSSEAKVEALRAIEPFSAWTASDLDALATRAEESVFAPGAVLMRDGQRGGPSTFVILSGEASVANSSGSTVVGPGTVLGTIDTIDGHVPLAATVTALTLMHVLAITG